MRVKAEKKVWKVPRNFRLKPDLNKKLIEAGQNFKKGDLIGETGVLETALEDYFERQASVNSGPSSISDSLPKHVSKSWAEKALKKVGGKHPGKPRSV